VEHFLGQTSNGGGAFQKTLAATTGGLLHTGQAITSAIIWTAGTLVYCNPYGTSATASHFLMPANVIIPVPFEDLNKLALYNADAAQAIVYCMYRYK